METMYCDQKHDPEPGKSAIQGWHSGHSALCAMVEEIL